LRAVAILLHTESVKPPSVVRRAFSGTPRRLIFIGAGLVAAVAVFIVVLTAGMAGARGGMSSISDKAAESNAANELLAHLDDMDAQAANALLVGFNPTVAVPAAVDASAAMSTYETDRTSADGELQRIGLNPALAERDTALLDALGGYEELISQAVYIDQSTKNEAPAAPPGAALALYERASTMMRTVILVDAADIRGEDYAEIDGRYTSAHDSAVGYTIAIGVLGVLLIALIVGANQYLSRRFRRIVGPALALAAVTVVAVTAVGAGALGNEAHEYKVAKISAFDSVSALTTAEAVSYDANGAESRWLLDRTTRNQGDFFTDADQVAHLPGVDAAAAAATPSSYYAGLGGAADALSVNTTWNTVAHVEIGGYLGTELNNITFDGEAQAAYSATTAFSRYVHDDGTIRDDANRGDMSDAVVEDIGLGSGQSNHDFAQYINSLQTVIGINETAFTGAVADGRNSLAVWTWLPYVVGVLLLAMVAVALYPRLREYR
jgi:hypothetical protein